MIVWIANEALLNHCWPSQKIQSFTKCSKGIWDGTHISSLNSKWYQKAVEQVWDHSFCLIWILKWLRYLTHLDWRPVANLLGYLSSIQLLRQGYSECILDRFPLFSKASIRFSKMVLNTQKKTVNIWNSLATIWNSYALFVLNTCSKSFFKFIGPQFVQRNNSTFNFPLNEHHFGQQNLKRCHFSSIGMLWQKRFYLTFLFLIWY